MKEQVKAIEKISTGIFASLLDVTKLEKKWTIKRYANKEEHRKGNNYSESIIEGNLLLDAGATNILELITGNGTPVVWNNANARIGVGDSSTAEDSSQTGLVAATNKAWVAMEATYPQVSGQTATWRAVFDGTTANFDWREFTIVNTSDDTGINLNRKVSSQGTKASGQIWTLDFSITLS